MVFPVLPSRWVIAPPDAVDDPDVFPFLPGQSFYNAKTPIWSTKRNTSVSGVDRSRALWTYPKWHFGLSYETIRDKVTLPELKRILTFFNIHGGSAKAFFFLDRFDNAVTIPWQFGVGDGTTTSFQLTRNATLGLMSFTEPVRGLNGNPIVYVNGTATTNFNVASLGKIVFNTAPAAGALLTWTGNFFFMCRFDKDELDLKQEVSNLWSLGSLDFTSIKP